MTDSNVTSVDIKNYLVSHGVATFGGSSGWCLFIGREPDQPDTTITLYDTAGDPPDPKWLLDYPRFQCRIRAIDYLAGYQKADQIKSLLLSLPSQVLGGTWYVGIWAVLDTYFLLTDARGRPTFVHTWRCIREPLSGQNRLPL